MAVERRALLRFMTLYAALFSAFGFASPFLPAFLAGRGLGPEELGLVLSAATALRLVCGPIGGRLADRLNAFRAELADHRLPGTGARHSLPEWRGAGRGLGCVHRGHACGRARGRWLWPLSDHLAERDGTAGDPVRRDLRACIPRRSSKRGSAIIPG